MPGTSLAMIKLTSVTVRPVFTSPSENTAKFTFGGLFTVTAGIPAPCSTVNGAKGLTDVSFAGTAAAAAIAGEAATVGGVESAT